MAQPQREVRPADEPGSGVSPDDVRRELRAIGGRRKRHREARRKLTEDTRAALARARAAGITVTEATRLAGIDRASAYQVYPRDEAA